MAPLRFRRQFLLTDAASAPAGWPTERLGVYTLATHPDATVARAEAGGVQVALVGVAVDPGRPERLGADLARDLAEAPPEAAAQAVVDAWAGVFVALRAKDERVTVHHDAGGLRAVFWTTEGPLRVASDPALIARVTDLEAAAGADAFEASVAYRRSGNLWPGTRTRFASVRRLLPNHVLRLPERRAGRVFPVAPLAPRTLDEGAEALARAVRGTVEGVAARAPVRLGLTAGWDSRVLLAAARPLAQAGRLEAYVVVHPGETDTTDARVARALAQRLGVPLERVAYPSTFRSDVAEALRASVTGGAPRPALLDHAFLDRATALNGNVSETVRTYYPRTPRPTAEHLAWLVGREAHPVLVSEYWAWLADAAPISERLGFDVLDLFYWEQRIGVWGATAWTGFHIGCEMVAPFSNRRLLRDLLGVPERFRGREHNPLYAAAIRRLWPEALAEPVNPQLKTRVIGLMERLGVYGAYARTRDAARQRLGR